MLEEEEGKQQRAKRELEAELALKEQQLQEVIRKQVKY